MSIGNIWSLDKHVISAANEVNKQHKKTWCEVLMAIAQDWFEEVDAVSNSSTHVQYSDQAFLEAAEAAWADIWEMTWLGSSNSDNWPMSVNDLLSWWNVSWIHSHGVDQNVDPSGADKQDAQKKNWIGHYITSDESVTWWSVLVSHDAAWELDEHDVWWGKTSKVVILDSEWNIDESSAYATSDTSKDNTQALVAWAKVRKFALEWWNISTLKQKLSDGTTWWKIGSAGIIEAVQRAEKLWDQWDAPVWENTELTQAEQYEIKKSKDLEALMFSLNKPDKEPDPDTPWWWRWWNTWWLRSLTWWWQWRMKIAA